jgi:hypothetical protein
MKQAITYLLNLVGADYADGGESLRLVPFVIEEFYRCVFGVSLFGGDVQPTADLLFCQRLMCAKCNQTIQGLCLLADTIENHLEDVPDGTGAAIVRNQKKNSFIGTVVLLKEFTNRFFGLIVLKETGFVVSFNHFVTLRLGFASLRTGS